MYWSPIHWIYFKATVLILCLYFFNTRQLKFRVHCCILYCLITSPPLPHPFAYFLSSGCLLQTPDILGVDHIAVPLTPVNSHWPQHCMYRIGLYTKNLIYTEKFGISFETQFGYMYWVTHTVLSTLKSELVPFPPPPSNAYITHKLISWKKVQITLNSKTGCKINSYKNIARSTHRPFEHSSNITHNC